MGTLGCINDMMRRDKENRELRKLNRDRIKERHKYLVENGKKVNFSHISVEMLEEIRKNTLEKEKLDNIKTLKAKLLIFVIALLLFLLCWILYQYCF